MIKSLEITFVGNRKLRVELGLVITTSSPARHDELLKKRVNIAIRGESETRIRICEFALLPVARRNQTPRCNGEAFHPWI